jgi:DNA invertase Pin-like site-specific DNA recombinase
MTTVAYIRVSKNDQDVNHQKLAILEFAQRQRLSIDNFISVQSSSRKSTKERKIDQLLGLLEPGDALIVSELSRIGRSVGEIITTIDTLVRTNIGFIAVKEGISLSGKADLQTKVMITMFSLFAEIERELISLRTKEALATAKKAGKKLGRPKGSLGQSKLDSKTDEIKKLLALGVSKVSIAKITGVSRSTLTHFIQSRGLIN